MSALAAKLLVLLGLVPLAAAANDLARAVQELGHRDFAVREAASQRLSQAGAAALPYLEKAAQDTDPEIRLRAGEILIRARLALPADFPAELAAELQGFGQLDLEQKQQLVRRLLLLGDDARPVLERLVPLEKDLDQRLDVFGPLLVVYGAEAERLASTAATEPVFAQRLAKLRIIQLIAPAYPLFTIRVVPKLEQAGHQKLADELFERAYQLLQEVLAAEPRNGECLNGSAWLCAVARRRLDEGLKQVQTALQAEPARPDYLDTQAELLFQKGQRETALKSIAQAIELAPGQDYYVKQQKRIRAGDPKSPPPPAPEIEAEMQALEELE